MRRRLLRYLLLTLLLSGVVTGLIFTVWYNMVEMEFEERQAKAILFVALTLFQNLAIALFTLPLVLQINTSNYLSTKTRLLYFLASPILVTIIFWFYFLSSLTSTLIFAFIIAPIAFCIINAFFYSRLKRIRRDNRR